MSLEKQILEISDSGVDAKARKLYVVGAVDDAMSKRFIIGLNQLDQSDGPITVVINSEGGEEYAGYAMYDAVTMAKNTVIMEGFGQVSSIAAAIFQAGDIRRLSPNANFMIHSGSLSPGDDVPQHVIIEMGEQVRKDNARYYDILAHSSNISIEEIEEACKSDTWYDAEEALDAGFCDEIMTPVKIKTKKKKRKKKS